MPDFRPVEQQPWRQPRAGEVLDDLPLSTGGVLRGEKRCGAYGLGYTFSPCAMPRMDESNYCYYHDKLQTGLTTPHIESYPVWPLPKKSYRLLAAGQQVSAVAA